MLWRKLGIVYGPDGSLDWAKSHAMIPTPIRINEDVIRVYVTFCDLTGIGRPGYVDVLAKNPIKVIGASPQPLLQPGKPGTFDENGVLVCSVIEAGHNTLYMYYAGFEMGAKIRYRLLTGLAISSDGGNSFQRYSQTPVLERSDKEMYFRCGPYCIYESKRFRLWYVAGSKWINLNGKPMPVYDIRYVESDDGLNWPASGVVQISLSDPDEHGFGRPYVIRKRGGGYRMFYSVRRLSFGSYRLGYAESNDGLVWKRFDDKLGLDVSADGFDSESIMYAAPIEVDDRLYVFYNGNEFGRKGFGLAVLEAE